jgi:hypothetical protein
MHAHARVSVLPLGTGFPAAFFFFFFFATKEELYYMIAGYINTLQALWITK